MQDHDEEKKVEDRSSSAGGGPGGQHHVLLSSVDDDSEEEEDALHHRAAPSTSFDSPLEGTDDTRTARQSTISSSRRLFGSFGCQRRAQELWSQLTLSEMSGSVGDLGTFIPLFVALARQRAIYVTPALFLAGVANVVTGWHWDVPMCVQPMKAIAAVALMDVLDRNQVTTAGICMGILLIVLGAFCIEWINRMVPRSIVSGMQMGVGMGLTIHHGLQTMAALPWWIGGQVDCLLLGLVCAIGSLCLLRENDSSSNNNSRSSSAAKAQPVGLYLFGLGTILALIQLFYLQPNDDDDDNQEGENNNNTQPWTWTWTPVVTWTLSDLSWEDYKIGLLQGALPQLPLTTLNSVISVCCLAHALYPEKRKPPNRTNNNTIITTTDPSDDDDDRNNRDSSSSLDAVVSRTQVALSVGLLNFIACPLGGLPCCHGAGGLAGQHKFGARHGASVVFLGLNKMILATILGDALIVPFLDAIPSSIVSVMIIIAGQELAVTGFMALITNNTTPQSTSSLESNDNEAAYDNDSPPASLRLQRQEEDATARLRIDVAVAMLTATVIVGLKKTHYGVVVGLVMHHILTWNQRRQDRPECNHDESGNQTATSATPAAEEEMHPLSTADVDSADERIRDRLV